MVYVNFGVEQRAARPIPDDVRAALRGVCVMDFELTPAQRELQARARRFVEESLMPYELMCEEQNGLPPAVLSDLKGRVLASGLNAINMPKELGGGGYSVFEQVLVEEQLGAATNALWDVVFRPANVLIHGTETQRREYLVPSIKGERRYAFAVTEEGAGSDATAIQTTAMPRGDGYVINGEKWFVTVGDIADFLIVLAAVPAGDERRFTLFLVDKDTPGVRIKRVPRYMHTFVFEHPIFALEDVRVGGDKVLGEVGQGYELTKDWFVEERLMIAARTVGASTRALELSMDFASSRHQFGRPIVEFQGVEFMLADMAAELMAAKSLLYRVSSEATRGELSRKRLHAEAAVAKLVCSETAGRIADRAVQIHGGRGYMREQPVERLWRELRVDRIWEGTSEIQRVIIGRELFKRGPDIYSGWPSDIPGA
jgi:alkylation response protein AidB-like acyl-CoA dehydrogenase